MLTLHSKFHFLLIFLMFTLVFPTNGLAAISQKPGVIITGYSISPNVILPGEIGTIEVTIANTASQASKTASEISGTEPDSVSQSVTLPVNAFIESAILKTKDFQILSGWYEDIGEIGPGQTKKITLSFQTDNDIPIGIRQIPVRISYMNADGTELEQRERIGIVIQGTADLGISKQTLDPEQISEGDMFNLVCRIENTGTDKAKTVRATLDIPFEGTKEAFVGTIRPDNDAPAVFTLKATKSGDISYTMKIEYQDDFGIHEETIPLHIFTQEKNGTGIILFILAAVLIIAGLLYWRKSHS